MRALLAAGLGATLSCLACGGSVNSEGGSGGSPGSGAGGAAGSTSGGASSAGVAGSAGDDSRLMPFADGRTWTFEVEAVDDTIELGACPNQTATVSGMGQTPEGPGWRYAPACVEGIYVMVQNGDDILAYQEVGGQLIEYMKEPVEEGATWYMYAWREEGEVTVPAGTFDDCWRREWVDDPSDYVVFCRGVGLVHTEAVSLNLRTLLASKSF